MNEKDQITDIISDLSKVLADLDEALRKARNSRACSYGPDCDLELQSRIRVFLRTTSISYNKVREALIQARKLEAILEKAECDS